jgi:hypothetical protein
LALGLLWVLVEQEEQEKEGRKRARKRERKGEGFCIQRLGAIRSSVLARKSQWPLVGASFGPLEGLLYQFLYLCHIYGQDVTLQ